MRCDKCGVIDTRSRRRREKDKHATALDHWIEQLVDGEVVATAQIVALMKDSARLLRKRKLGR